MIQPSTSLIALSFVGAIVVSLIMLTIAQRLCIGRRARSVLWFVGGSCAVGSGLWAMHFIALLGFQQPQEVSYSFIRIGLSYLAAQLPAFLCLHVLRGARPHTALPLHATFAGLGVCTTHYMALAAVRPTAWITYDPWLLGLSVIISITATWTALHIAARIMAGARSFWTNKTWGALIVATSVVAMSWASSQATHYLPLAPSVPAGVQIDTRWVVLAVAIVTSLILATLLLAITLDHRLQEAIAASASALRATNSQLEERVADRTRQLSQEEARTRAIIVTAQDCIISFDVAGRVTEFNPAAEREFGYHPQQAIGEYIVELIVPAPQRDNMRMLLQGYASGQGHIALNEPREGEMQRRDGSKFPAEFTIAKVMLGNELFFTMFLRDITARRAAQAALFTAKEAAEAASEAKTTFLATMSHEIRTPMNALLGLQELLSLSRLDDDQRETVRLLRQSSKSLLRLIDDILDFSKIEAGKLEIGREPTLIRSLLDDLCATFAVMAHDKGLKLVCSVEPAVPAVVMADALRVRQILGNLLSNAIKFTSRGDVSMHADFRLDEQGRGLVEFRIQDHGIGMSADVLATCGEPFQQADASMARRYGGSGLGLAICRRLSSLMHGSFEVRSQLNVGTQVTVRLPLEPVVLNEEPFEPDISQGLVLSVPTRAPSVEEAAQRRQLILVVDDHPTNRHLLVQQLEWLGYACEACASGHAALERYQQRLRDGNPYAVTITDCQMPEMDGYELARQIRVSEAGSLHKTVLIAFTATTMRGFAQLGESCGFSDLLAKPVDLGTLKAKLDRWLPLPQGRAMLVPVEPPPTTSIPSHAPLTAELQFEFCSAHEEDMALLQQGVEDRDVLAINRGAHRIRGAARMFGALGIDQAATQLQHAARTENWRQIKQALNLLRAETGLLFAQFGAQRRSSEEFSVPRSKTA